MILFTKLSSEICKIGLKHPTFETVQMLLNAVFSPKHKICRAYSMNIKIFSIYIPRGVGMVWTKPSMVWSMIKTRPNQTTLLNHGFQILNFALIKIICC